ncbi:MAG: Rossmann-like domain-containing protein [Anaerolineae bacterium]
MSIVDDLLLAVPQERVGVREVRVGPFWTVVWTERGSGLASTQRDAHTPHGHSLIRWVGDLQEHTGNELAGLLRSKSPMETGIGMAALNALLEVDEQAITDRNASEEIIDRGRGKRVVIVGHFPFIPSVRREVGHLDVLELDPGPDELPPDAAADVLPQADVVAITGTSLLNRTFDGLIRRCRRDAFVMVLGPTTPLSPVLFDYGVDLIAGTQVTDPQVAMALAGQGAIFRQMRGVRLVTLGKGC